MAFNKNKVAEVARKYVEKGQLDKAIKEYLRVVREDPKDVRVWLKIGDLYAKKGARTDAIDTYLKVARFYSEQGFDLKAVAVYKQILKLDPRLIEVNLKLAELYRQMGLMKEAMEQFETVASHFHREGKTKEALATVRQLVDLDPENVATRIKLAELYSKEGMVTEAVTEFAQACDYLRANNRQDDFVKVAERLLWHKPDNLELSRELADMYLQRNDPRRALYKLQACFKANSRDIETLALLAQAFQALEQRSKTIQVLKELARVLDEDGNRARASEVHQKILRLAPGDTDSLAYVESGPPTKTPPPPAQKTSPAPQLAGNDLPKRRSNPTGSMPLVNPHLIPGLQYQEAEEEEEEAEILVEDDFTSELTDDSEYDSSIEGEMYSEEIAKILTDADVYVRYGLHQKAIDHLRRIFDLDPDNIEAHEQLKEILLNQGREREAIEELMRLASLTANRDPDSAEEYLRELLGLDGTYQPAFELATRFHLNIAGNHEIEIVDSLDTTGITEGGVAPIDDVLEMAELDLSDDDLHMSSARPESDSPYELSIEPDDDYELQQAPDPSAVTMELSMDEVESVLELVDNGRVGPQSFNETYSDEIMEPPVFDPEDARRFDAEPGYDPAGEIGEPVFDPLDAAQFDAERQTMAYPSSNYGGASSYHDSPTAATVQVSPGDFDAEPLSDMGEYVDALDRADDTTEGGNFVLASTQLVDGPPLYEVIDEPPTILDEGHDVGLETVDTGLDVLEEKLIDHGPATVEHTANGIENDLEEAEFYVSQRLYDDARDIIHELLGRYPQHPLLLAKLREVDEIESASHAASRETYVPASKLDRESLQQFEPDLIGGGDKQPTVLLENPIDDEDADTHYDLGLAYKEMGLFEDAIKAFKKVLVVPGREVQCRLMIGLCQREQNNVSEAIHQFKAGLHAPEIIEHEQLSLYYEIASSYERINDPKEALYFYELTRKRDPGYRDVVQRIRAIEEGIGKPTGDPHRAQAVADDAEAAIDSLLAETDTPGRHSGSR